MTLLRTLLVLGSGVAMTTPLAAQSLVRTFLGTVPSPSFGQATAAVGDLDGDGVADLLFGEPTDPTNGAGAGSAAVLSGATGLEIHRVFGSAANEALGSRVSGVGDADGDGVPDFAVTVPGRPSQAGGPLTRGVVQLHSGCDASLLHVLEPVNGLGVSPAGLAGAGDVNGDGFADLMVGETTSFNSAGSVTVFSGRDGTTLYEIPGFGTLARTGTAVSAAGDVDDDGFDDFAVASPGPFGRVDVFSGADGSTLRTIDAGTTGGRVGNSVDRAGDLDGDGVDDLVLGIGFVIFGPPGIAAVSGADGSLLWTLPLAGVPAGGSDIDGDGTPDVIVGDPFTTASTGSGVVTIVSGRSQATLAIVQNPMAGRPFADRFGSAGDLTRDGLAEFWVTGEDPSGRPAVFVFDGDFVATPGIARRRGAPCLGSDNRLPSIDVVAAPRIGEPLEFRLRAAPPLLPVALHLGATTDVDLTPFGAIGCRSLASPLAALPAQTDVDGRVAITIPVPSDPALIGAGFATQWTIVDPAANGLSIVESAALDLTVGG